LLVVADLVVEIAEQVMLIQQARVLVDIGQQAGSQFQRALQLQSQ
jgi:hypothetical protein